jgi:hypothetical protein
MLADELLASVPDWGAWTEAGEWLADGCARVERLSPAAAESGRFATSDWTSSSSPGGHFGMYEDPTWRRFVLATFMADVASYPAPVDRVSFDRLAYVMHAFPTGFRVFWAQDGDGRWWPVGYSAWYPMYASAFALFVDDARALRDRMVVPATSPAGGRPLVYLFNYSVAGTLRRTALSSSLIKRLAADVAAAHPAGLATIAVSADGCRVAERFGMRRTGAMTLDGADEVVFAARIGSP